MSIKRFDESCMEGGGVAPHANGEYVKCADHIASHSYDEAKERELFESEFEKPSAASFVGGEYRYMGQVGRSEMVLFIEFVGSWEGWKKCAKSRARSAE